jgi:hypothetical protein
MRSVVVGGVDLATQGPSGDHRHLLKGTTNFFVFSRRRSRPSGSVPMLSVGQLIGRRVEMRRVMRVLTDEERSVSEIGQKAGVQILGIGGVGKSAIAGCNTLKALLLCTHWCTLANGGSVWLLLKWASVNSESG